MPVFLLWSVGALAFGGAAKLIGDGVKDTADATVKTAVVGTLLAGAYLIAKKKGVI